jgi:hypothetical protein
MSPSNQPDARPTREELAAQLSEELIRLRNALVSLAIYLKDWQFEADPIGKLASQELVTETLNRYRLHPQRDANSSDSSRSPAAKD